MKAVLAPAMMLTLLAAPQASAATKVEGQYQLQLQLRKDLRAFPWDYDSNDGSIFNAVELRLFSQPLAGMESFLRVEGRWNRNDNFLDRPVLQFRDGHVGIKREARGRGVNTLLFSRQRRFWVDNYLIRFVEDRDNAQGLRIDSWGFLGMNTSLIFGDQSDQMDPSGRASDYERNLGYPAPLAPTDSLNRQAARRTDDHYVARARREFFHDRRLRLGFTYNRQEGWAGRDSVSDRRGWVSVLGVDTRYRIGSVDFSLEYGQSAPQNGDVENPVISFFKRPSSFRLSDRSVVAAEIRTLRVGNQRIGYFNVTPGYWNRGARWTNALGGPGADESGFIIQSYYLLPERAITFSNQLSSYGNRVFSKKRVQEVYNELYVEFVNGFTGKTAYRRRDEYETRRNRERRDSYLSWFNELQVESRLAWIRVQSKVQNIGRLDRKQLFVVENSINLTNHTKIYTRYALGNDPSRLRKGIFAQFQYRPTDSMEIFLQYGPDYIGGGSNPVEDSNLAGSGDQFDEFRFTLKGTF